MTGQAIDADDLDPAVVGLDRGGAVDRDADEAAVAADNDRVVATSAVDYVTVFAFAA